MPYPLVAWTTDEITERIDKLNQNELYYESVIVSTQLIERLLKRVIRSELAAAGKRLSTVEGSRRLILVDAFKLSEIDDSLKKHCQSIGPLTKEAWKLVIRPRIELSAAQTFDKLMGNGGWSTLMVSHRIGGKAVHNSVRNAQSLLNLPKADIPYGLNHLRHKLIHAPNAAPASVVALHAYFGREVVGMLLDSNGGLRSLGIKDPTKACRMSKRKGSTMMVR